MADMSEHFRAEQERNCGVPQKYSDTEILNFLQAQNDKKRYTGKCLFRWSIYGRGWRLHETTRDDGFQDVRSAIMKAMDNENQN